MAADVMSAAIIIIRSVISASVRRYDVVFARPVFPSLIGMGRALPYA